MSDLQEVIAANAVKAYNEGFERGKTSERKEIIEQLKGESQTCEKAGLWANGEELRSQLQQMHLGLNAVIRLLEGEQK